MRISKNTYQSFPPSLLQSWCVSGCPFPPIQLHGCSQGLAAEWELLGQHRVLFVLMFVGIGERWLLGNQESAKYTNYLKHRSLCSQCCHWTSYSVFCVYMKSRHIHPATSRESLLFSKYETYPRVSHLSHTSKKEKSNLPGLGHPRKAQGQTPQRSRIVQRKF